MACTIVATAGSASANSYATIQEGDDYHSTHLYADDWTDTDDDTKCKALQMATRLLDQWFEWNGETASNTQALLWPRDLVTGPNGYLEANDAIPTGIRDGTCELARQLIAENRTADSDTGTQGVKKVKAGSVELELTGTATSKPIPDAVMGFVAPYGQKRGVTGGSVKLYRA